MKRQFALLFLVLSLPLTAQFRMITFSGGGGGTRDGKFQGNATFRLPLMSSPVLTNAPYSGEQVAEGSQTLADGTNITRPARSVGGSTWRDSQGRVRMERSFMSGGPTTLANVPTLVQIEDPVAGYAYIMDNITRVAHRIKLTPVPQRPTAAARPMTPAGAMAAGGQAPAGVTLSNLEQMQGMTGAPPIPPLPNRPAGAAAGMPNTQLRPQFSYEDLGSKMIDGVLVYGTRRTQVVPVGMQGNDRPITTTNETWTSRELQLTVLSVNFNPANGTQTNKIANLSRNEPDPALFFVPADYTIVDETEGFTIKWGEK